MFAHRKVVIASAGPTLISAAPAATTQITPSPVAPVRPLTDGSASRLIMVVGEGGNMPKRYIILLAIGGLCCAPGHASSHRPATQQHVASQIKSDVAQIVAGINGKDIDRATKFDAPDLISMESMRPPSYGAKADREGLSMVFKYAPAWHLRMIDEAVDVAKSGDMAMYRSTYDEDSARDGAPYTHKVNYIAGFRRDADGMWRVHWSVVCAQSASHKK